MSRSKASKANRAAMKHASNSGPEWPLQRQPYNPALHQSIMNADVLVAAMLVARSERRKTDAATAERIAALRTKPRKPRKEPAEVDMGDFGEFKETEEELVGA